MMRSANLESGGARFRPATTKTQTEVGMPRSTFNMGQPRGPGGGGMVTSPGRVSGGMSGPGFGMQPGGGGNMWAGGSAKFNEGFGTPGGGGRISGPSGSGRNRFRMM